MKFFLEYDPDSDFLTVHKSHRQHDQEMRNLKEKISLWRVRDKYFKVKLPNLLTWAEKEHIRYLNGKEPDEWTPEILSEKFPIDQIHVQKLLKAKWQPRNEEKARRHDEKVLENWKLLERGEFEVPPQLHEHLMKFRDRAAEAPKKFEARQKLAHMIRTKNTEFSDIITSCKKSAEKVDKRRISFAEERPRQLQGYSEADLQEQKKPSKEMTHNNRRMTLEELNKVLEGPDEEETTLSTNSNTQVVQVKATPGEITDLSEDVLREISMPRVRDHIKVPKKLWKKGATYKLGDCFYDDDGELLYRVPGMRTKR